MLVVYLFVLEAQALYDMRLQQLHLTPFLLNLRSPCARS